MTQRGAAQDWGVSKDDCLCTCLNLFFARDFSFLTCVWRDELLNNDCSCLGAILILWWSQIVCLIFFSWHFRLRQRAIDLLKLVMSRRIAQYWLAQLSYQRLWFLSCWVKGDICAFRSFLRLLSKCFVTSTCLSMARWRHGGWEIGVASLMRHCTRGLTEHTGKFSALLSRSHRGQNTCTVAGKYLDVTCRRAVLQLCSWATAKLRLLLCRLLHHDLLLASIWCFGSNTANFCQSRLFWRVVARLAPQLVVLHDDLSNLL